MKDFRKKLDMFHSTIITSQGMRPPCHFISQEVSDVQIAICKTLPGLSSHSTSEWVKGEGDLNGR